MPRPGIEPGTPGSVIERHNHEAKRSGPVRLVIYAPYIFTYISIICTSLCRALLQVSCGPQYICTSCCQTFFRHSDVKFDIQGLKPEIKRLCTLGHKSVEDKEWICQQCANSLKKNNLNKYLPFCQARLR